VIIKPIALTVRLFANMLGGHMVVIVFTLLIFIFGAYGVAFGAATTVVSLAFSLFMLLLDTLVSFIQAYVFTILSTMFISMAHVHPEAEQKQIKEN
jgi:F-type H+-transporting ATPase subunit a